MPHGGTPTVNNLQPVHTGAGSAYSVMPGGGVVPGAALPSPSPHGYLIVITAPMMRSVPSPLLVPGKNIDAILT